MNYVSRYLTCNDLEVHFMAWGDPDNEPVIMWHGLARNGRDFDDLANRLSDRYYIIAPDTPGRGLSQWAENPAKDYCFDAYGEVAGSLVDQLGFNSVRWVGTSMGAVIGMVVASKMLKGRVSHLVLNDIGPDVPAEAIERIVNYVGNPPVFDNMAEMDQWLRTIYATFGQNTDRFWNVMRDYSARRTDDGRVTVHYDPKIVMQFTEHKHDLDRWDDYDAIACPTMLIRGETSDVLPMEVAEEMLSRGPKPEFHNYPGFGHAPTLCSDEEIRDISSFLAQ